MKFKSMLDEDEMIVQEHDASQTNGSETEAGELQKSSMNKQKNY